MQKFIKKNTIISIFGLVSILIAVSYAVTYNMPDYFGIEGWYSLLNNISISYIAALIFYVLQVYKPECENSRRAQAVLKPLFLDLIEFIEVTITCCRKYVSVDEKGKIAIDWWNKEQKVIYFVPVIEDSNSSRQQSAIRKSEIDLRGMETIYKSKIKEIKERIDFRECDQNILNAFSKLEAVTFFRSTFIPALMFDRTIVGIPGFQNSVDNLEVVKDEFKRCCGITCKYEVRDADNMEIAMCEAIFCKNALQASSVAEFNEASQREFIRLQLKPLITDEEQLNGLIDTIMSEIIKHK